MSSRTRSGLGFIRLGGGLSAALLLILAQPPFDLFPLSVFALAPLAMGFASLPRNPGGAWAATVLGGAFGGAYWVWTLVWIPVVVAPHFSWAIPGYLLLLTILISLSALCGRLTHALHQEQGLPLALAFPLAWVGVEWARAHFPFGLDFPWMGLGLTLSSRPELLGIAEWVGEGGVAFWLAGVNGLIASAVLRGGPGKARRAWGAAALAVVVPSALGVARARTLPVSPGPTVGVVGTSVPTELRISPSLAGAEALKQVLSAVGGISAGATDLLVLPEGTVPFPALSQDAAGTLEELRTVARAKGAPVVFGGLGEDQAGGEGVATTNSAFLLSPSGGPHGPVQRYDKVRLVPGMEAGSYRKGGGQVVFVAGEWSYGPLICYESLFGGAARKARSSGAQVLLNLSSDIWFGHQGTLVGSLFLTQHPAHLVLRAIETRTPIVRAANGGFSFLMDPLGRMMSEAKSGAGEVVVGQVPVFVGTTLFARTGDWVGPTCALLCALALLMTGLGVRGRRGPLTDWPPSG